MPGDPYVIFREAEQYQRDTLKTLWPELHAALAPPPGAPRGTRCAITLHDTDRPAVGRMSLNGTPACADCLARCRRPGGYPLERIDPREWRE